MSRLGRVLVGFIQQASRVYVPPLMRTKVITISLMLMLTMLCGGASVALDAHPAGTSLVPDPVGSGTAAWIKGGGKVTYGWSVLTLSKDASRIRVTGVHLVKAKKMTLIGARLAGPRRPVYQYIAVRGFPGKYNRRSVRAIGTVITPPRRGWELMIGLRVAMHGSASMRGVRVTYRVVGHRQVEQQTFHTTFGVCVRESQLGSDGTCSIGL